MANWLITGCSSGIGRGIAKAVLAAGHNVAATARRVEALADIASAYPETAATLRLDLNSALDQMNKYFLHQQMPVVSSRYWNMVHGNTPDEVRRDAEGLQIMRVLGRNMAWLLKLKDLGEQAGVPLPEQEDSRLATNFIR